MIFHPEKHNITYPLAFFPVIFVVFSSLLTILVIHLFNYWWYRNVEDERKAL